MKRIFTFLLFLLSTSLYAQNWNVEAATNEYKIEKGSIVCQSTQGYDYEYALMRYTNLTSEAIDLSFNFEVWYDDFCNTCGNADHGSMRLISIPANGVVEGACATSEDYLKTFAHSITINERAWKSKLTKIVFNKIAIK
jgi:hypothetical protein